MKKSKRYQRISIVLVWLILLCGIIPAIFTKPVMVSCLKSERKVINERIDSFDQIVLEPAVCTPCILSKIGRVTTVYSERMASFRGRSRIMYVFYQTGRFIQERFYYQRTEGREDGKIFSNQTVIVEYIRRKDSGDTLYSVNGFIL